MSCQDVLTRIDELQKEYIGFWEDICNLESPSEDKARVDAVGAYVIQKAQARGWQVEVAPMAVSGDAVCITMNPEAGQAPVVFSAHMDTVHPVGSFGEPAVHIEGDKIYGPGVCDCKGGIAAGFLAMAALEDCGFVARPVKLVLQSDEEVSSRYSNKETVKFMAQCARGAVAFLNAEGHVSGQLVLTRKGISRYRLTVHGKSVHASQCYKGVSAICEAAHKILELERMKDKAGMTCNCGLISGGTAENTVPEVCVFTADIRFADQEQMLLGDKLIEEVAARSYLPGSRCEVELVSRRCAMEPSDRNFALLDRMNEIYSANGLPVLAAKGSSGGSDAADMTVAGIPCIDSIGTEGENIHTPGEYALLSSLAQSAKRMAAIAAEI